MNNADKKYVEIAKEKIENVLNFNDLSTNPLTEEEERDLISVRGLLYNLLKAK